MEIDTNYKGIGERYKYKKDDVKETEYIDEIYLGYRDTHKGRVAIGYKNIEYHGINKTILGIVVRGTAEDDDWDSDFDVGDLKLREKIQEKYVGGYANYEQNYDRILRYELNNGILNYESKYSEELLHFAGGYPDWTHRYHHAGFDIVSNRIFEIIKDYMKNNNFLGKNNISFWVTGHSMGAGVGNLISAELLNKTEVNNKTDNVYSYLFAPPNNFYRTDNVKQESDGPGFINRVEYREPKSYKYRCIFNIVNDDDFVPKLPMEECNWTKYGRVATMSVEKDIVPRLKKDKNLTQDNDYCKYLISKYKSNKGAVDIVISSFNGMYNDKTNMRSDSYSYDNKVGKKNIEYKTKKELEDDILFYAEYTKPYQKNDLNKNKYVQNQMPVYLFMSVANSMHGQIKDKDSNGNEYYRKQRNDKKYLAQTVWENQYILLTTKFGFNSWGAKWSLVITGSPVVNGVEYPHYLETYYSLTKEMTTLDFK